MRVHNNFKREYLLLKQKVWNKGKALIMDSNFFVLKSILEIRKKGVYENAPIKNTVFA